ncbi:MAG: HDOD domain-containing protein [Desulfobacula sp.]|nr:HDOD domain-containing protein [Desulfobacula sp.]
MNRNLHLPSTADINLVLNLEDKKLPSFPQVAAKLLEAFREDTASLEDLSKIVGTDPGLSVRILEIVNSAMYGLGRKITALSEAMVFLGLSEIKKLAIEMTVFDKLFKSGRSTAFDRLLFWRHSLSVAVLSSQIAKEVGYPEPEEAYISGLLHDVGKIFLDIRGRKNYGEFIVKLSTSTDLVIEKERSVIGLGHDDVGAYLCSSWKLPEKITQVVKYHHQPFGQLDLPHEEKRLISIVSFANFLCWTQGIGSFDFIRPPILPPEVAETLKPETLDVTCCINHMNTEIEKISEFYQFVFPSADELRENILEANLKLSRANTRYYYQEDPLARVKDNTRNKISSDMDFELGKSLARAKSIKEVLDIVMYQIGRVFEPQNWSILLKDQKTSDMVFSIVVGINKDKLKGAKLPKGEGIAGFIMQTGESLVIEDVETDKHFSKRVDKHTGFETRSIIGTPLKTGGKIFGVIELINRVGDEPFSQQDLDLLSSIAEYAAIAIERAYYNQTLTTLATKDALTGLKNRWSFERAISNKNEMIKNYGSIFSILIIDIQGLRHIAAKGIDPDDILKKMASEMVRTKRREDDIFRYGENTFVIVLPQTYSDGSQIAKNRLSTRLSQAIDENSKLPVKINIFTQTIGDEDTDQLKQMISDSLSKSIEPLKENTVADLEYSLQELLEKDKEKQSGKKDKEKNPGKTVSLGGRFVRLKTGESAHMRVEQVSLKTIGFRISRSHRIQTNDFLDISFILDNIKKDLVERRIVVREIQGNFVVADFYNPPPYAKNLGFYLMS